MARKKYSLQFEIDSAKAEAAAKRVNASMLLVDKNSAKAVANIDRLVASFGNLGAAASAAANASKQGSQSAAAAAAASSKSQAQSAALAARAKMQADALAAKASVAAADRAARAYEGAANRAARANEGQANRSAKAAQSAQALHERAARQQQLTSERAAKAAQAAIDRQMKDQARAAAAAQRQQDAAMRAAARAQAAQDRLVTKSMTDQQVRQTALNNLMRRSNKARVDDALKTLDTEKSGFLEATAGALGLQGALTGVGAAATGIGIVVTGVQSLAESFVSAKESALEMARSTLDTLSDLREVAAIKEKAFPGDEELKHHLDVRKASGMTHPEAVTLRNELANTMGTVDFDKINEDQRAKLEIFAAQFAARTGGGEGTVKARAAAVGLLPSFMPGNNLQAEDVADAATKVDILLGKGRGTQKQSTEQYAKVLTAMSSGTLVGKFHDPYAAAGLTALASKSGPGAVFTTVEQGVRGLQRFGKQTMSKGAIQSQGQTLTEAGILDDEDPDQKFRKMFRYLDTKLVKGQSVDKFLQDRGFANQGERRSISQFYESHLQGDYERIMDSAKEPVERGIAAKRAKEYLESKGGRYKVALATRDAATAVRGLKHVDYETGRVEAEDELTDQGVYDTGWGKFRQKVASASTFGLVEGKEVLLNEQIKKNAAKRIKELGGTPPPATNGFSAWDVMSGFAGGPAGLAGMAGNYFAGNVQEHVFKDKSEETTQLERVVKELEKLNAKADKPGGAPAPTPVPAPNAQKAPPSTLGSVWQLMGW